MNLDPVQATLLAAAKLWLTSPPNGSCPPTGDMPYLAVALYALRTVATDQVERMSTDPQWRLYVNPRWLDDPRRTAPEVAQHLAHHVWHLLADHAGRALDMQVGPRTARDWADATDATIHELVQTLPGTSLEPPLLRDSVRRMRRGLAAEQYYAMLTRLPVDQADRPEPDPGEVRGLLPSGSAGNSPDPGCGSGCDGLPRRYELGSDEDEGGLSCAGAEEIRRRVAVEFKANRGHGHEPGEWDRWVAHVLDPLVDWRNVLQAAVRRGLGWAVGNTHYTYSRISRRQAAAGPVVLPALRRPAPRVAVVVDTSGSVDDGLLAQALGEVDGVLGGLGVTDAQVTVLAVDAAVQTVQAVHSAAAVRLAGGGGTNMTVGIEAALALRPRTDVVVVLTDGFTGWPAAPPPAPVVGVLIGRNREELPATPWWIQRVECVR